MNHHLFRALIVILFCIQHSVAIKAQPHRQPSFIGFDVGTGLTVWQHATPTYFPTVQGVAARSDPGRGLAVSELAATTAGSFLSRNPNHPVFDPAADVRGPITVAAAADLSASVNGHTQRTRLVVVGDSDFALNRSLLDAGNSRLAIQAVDWLALNEDLVSVSANLPSLRPLAMTQARLRYATFVTAGVIPLLFLLGGAMVWAIRRPR